MIDKLPLEILTSEICSKLTLVDTVQVGIALKQNSSSTIFDPERFYPKQQWIDQARSRVKNVTGVFLISVQQFQSEKLQSLF